MAEQDIDENLQLQIDEVEALSSIYGDDWCIVDDSSRCYCIGVDERNVGEDQVPARWRVSLQVLLPDEYPSLTPPIYQINAPWLRGQERENLSNGLDQIYRDNQGDSIIYLWVEHIRQFLQSKSPSDVISSTEEKATEEDICEEDFEEEYDSTYYYELVTADKPPVVDNDTDKQGCPSIEHGSPLTDRRSTFQAHLARVTNKQQVQDVLDSLLRNKKIANATHNMYAYRIKTDSGSYLAGCDDDGETQAGSQMLHLLKITSVENVLVVVSRWYGGIQLGPDRFKHINNCTRNMLVKHNYITVKESPNKGASGKKHQKGKS